MALILQAPDNTFNFIVAMPHIMGCHTVVRSVAGVNAGLETTFRPVGTRWRPNNDGTDGKFTRNWTDGTDKKIPWPVKAIVAGATTPGWAGLRRWW